MNTSSNTRFPRNHRAFLAIGFRRIVFSLACLFISSAWCKAAIILDADEVFTTSSPSSSTFGHVDVFVTYDGVSPAGAMVGSYNFELNLTPSATGNVRFIEAVLTSPSTSSSVIPRTPLFAGQNPLEFLVPGQNIQVADNLPGLGQSVALMNNRALASIRYEVLPGASGSFNFTFNPSSTFLFDGTNNQLPLTSLQSGTITISAIPEPCTFLIVPAMLVLGMNYYRRKK